MNTPKTLVGGLALLALAALGWAQPAVPGQGRAVRGAAAAPAAGSGLIAGVALDAAGRTLPDTRVQVRHLGSGGLVQIGVTDGDGRVTFSGLPPGSYLLEMTAADGAVVATSDTIIVTDNQTVQGVVQLAARIRGFAWWLGSTTTLALAQAASLGVLAIDGGQPVSPQR